MRAIRITLNDKTAVQRRHLSCDNGADLSYAMPTPTQHDYRRALFAPDE